MRDLRSFIQRKRIVTVPDHDGVVVAPTPDFYRWTFASLWTAGPFESKRLAAYYYLTTVDPAWSKARRQEHLRDFSHATLWSISMHEVYPGHFLHFEHLREVDSPLRKSVLFTPTSFVEGWAHYCEQMMLDQGLRAREHRDQAGPARRGPRAPGSDRRRPETAHRGFIC